MPGGGIRTCRPGVCRRPNLSPCVGLLLLAGLAADPSAQGTDPVFQSPPTALPAPARVGDTLAFTVAASDPGGEALAYSWSFGDGTNSTPYSSVPGASHRYTEPGRYAVIVRVRNSRTTVSTSFLQAVHLPAAPGRPRASSTLLYDAARKRAWTVNPDNNSVACIDGETLALRFEKAVGRNPRTVAQSGDGPVWAANQDDATLSVLDPVTGAILRTVALPPASRPFGLAFGPDGKALYVSLQALGRLLRIDPAAYAVTGSVEAGPQPRHLAVTADGKSVWAARFVSPRDSGEVVQVDAASFSRVRAVGLAYDPSGDTETSGGGVPNYLGALAIPPSGERLFIPSKKDNTRKGLALDGRRLDFESTVRTVISQVDLAAGREDLAARFDIDNSDLASALLFSPLGDLAFAAIQGSNRVDVLDPYNAMASLLRLPETGLAPQGLALDEEGKRLYVQNFMSRTVAVYDVATVLSNKKYEAPRLAVVKTVEKENLPEAVLRGKRIFYNSADDRMTRDGYMACATCHLEGNSDRRVWDFTDRGEGLRRTTSLLGRAGLGQGPVHWSANFDEIQDFEHDMRGPMAGTGFLDSALFLAGTRGKTLGDRKAGLSPELDDLAAYVASLAAFAPSPYRSSEGTLTPDGKKGEAIFKRADVGCVRCHAGSQFTDSRLPDPAHPLIPGPGAHPGDFVTAEGFLLHDVGTLKPTSGKRLNDTLRGLDTPTLLGVWEGGPYLHDGSAATLLDVIATANPDDRHGKTSHLDAAEKDQLVAYLRQLGGEGTSGVIPGGGIETGNSGWSGISARPLPGGRWRIAWTLPMGLAADAELTFHDLAGRTMLTVRPASTALGGAGRGHWDWDGTGAGGSRAPPGVYGIRLRSGGHRWTAKAALGPP